MQKLIKTTVWLITLLVSFASIAQQPTDSISYNPRKLFPGVRMNGKLLSAPRLKKLMYACPSLKADFQALRRNNITVSVAGLVFWIGGSAALSSSEATRPYAWVPFAAVLAGSVPFDIFYYRPRFKKVIDKYNRECR